MLVGSPSFAYLLFLPCFSFLSLSSLSAFLSALVKDKESWQKEREEMLATLRSSQNEAKSVSVFAN
jgi:ABC-type Na+ efflux pump permease subunit